MIKVILVLSIVSLSYQQRKCNVDHYWRPYNGTIPPHAVKGGNDENKTQTYIAKIVPLDYLWITPAQLYEGNNYVDFKWHDPHYKLMRIDKFIEVLCEDYENAVTWRSFKNSLDEVTKECCLVQAGIAKYPNQDHIYITYIGRVFVNEVSYVGRIYQEGDGWEGIHVMVGNSSRKYYNNLEVLAYDCILPEKLEEAEVEINHYWKPYNGIIPLKAVEGGEDKEGNQTYIAKIVPLDSLWTTPAQLYKGNNYIDFKWNDSQYKLMRIDKFIQVLCQEYENAVTWRSFNNSINEVKKDCSLVQAGIGKFPNEDHIYITHIGRVLVDGAAYVGRIYQEEDDWKGLHVMMGNSSKKYYSNLEVLAYNCVIPKK